MNNHVVPEDGIVTLNVGGTLYATTISTLTQYSDSMIGAMFSGSMPTTCDSNGHFFIDRDGTLFRYILNFLRSSKLHLPKDFHEIDQLIEEADFYQIIPLIQALQKLKIESQARDTTPGIYLEVKDNIQCYKGWHVITSLTGPLDKLKDSPPFDEELIRSRAYTAWKEGQIEELFLEKGSKTRLDWAQVLKSRGWQFLASTSNSYAKTDHQQYTIVDKWFLSE